MKKFFFTLAFCGLALTGMAQQLSGLFFTGTLQYSSNNVEQKSSYDLTDQTQSSFTFGPSVGYFLSNRLAVGATLGYNSTTGQGIYDYSVGMVEKNTTAFSVGPFVRLYQPLGARAALYGQIAASYISGEDEFEGGPSSSLSGGIATLSPGVVFFPSQSIGLELSLNGVSYQELTYESGNSPATFTDKIFNVNLGFNNVAVGLSFYLGRTEAE